MCPNTDSEDKAAILHGFARGDLKPAWFWNDAHDSKKLWIKLLKV